MATEPGKTKIKLGRRVLESRLPAGKKRLPRVSKAYIPTDEGKNRLKDYALKPDHERGGHKANLFRERLGFEQDDWKNLHDQILRRLLECWVRRWYVRIVPEDNPTLRVGLAYEVYVPIDGHEGRRCWVLTAWRLDARMAPFLTTTRPKDPPD